MVERWEERNEWKREDDEIIKAYGEQKRDEGENAIWEDEKTWEEEGQEDGEGLAQKCFASVKVGATLTSGRA